MGPAYQLFVVLLNSPLKWCVVFFFLKCEPEQEAGVKHLSAQLGPVILPMLITRAMHLR